MADQDNRQGPQRPRTKQDDKRFSQPVGWAGLDPIGKRTMDPVRTFETPLVFFPGDILVPANTTISIPLPQRCFQIAFINLIPGVFASFNGGGARTIKDGFVMNGEFSTLDVATDALGSVIIQLAAY